MKIMKSVLILMEIKLNGIFQKLLWMIALRTKSMHMFQEPDSIHFKKVPFMQSKV